MEEKYIVKEEDELWDVQQENNGFIEPTADERLTLHAIFAILRLLLYL